MPSYLTYEAARQTLDGMLIMMACYALFSFITHRQRIYILYAGYIMCMLARLALRDYASIHPNDFALAHVLENTFEAIAVVAYNQFAIMLMRIPQHDPPSHRMLRIMTGNLIVTACLEWICYALGLPTWIAISLYMISRLQLVGGTIFIVPRLLRRRHPTLTYFITGTAFFVSGAFATLLIDLLSLDHLIGRPLIYMEAGIVIEVLFFTMGISAQHRLDEQEKINAQAALIDQLQENERKQQKLNRIRDDIARDLHDTVGSDLSTISMLASAAAMQPGSSSDLLQTVGQTARRVIDTMREIVWNLNTANQTPENIAFRFREIAYEFFNEDTTSVSLDLDPTLADHLSVVARKELLLVYKESLENIRKHAQARHVRVRLNEASDGQLQLAIDDDGIGFDSLHPARQSGLQNLQQRAAALGGQITIQSQPGQGTRISLRCPLIQPMLA